MKNITPAQYRELGNPRRRISKEDQARLDKGLEPIESEDQAQMKVVAYLEMLKNETGKIIKYTAVPNNTFAGTYIEGQKYKSNHAAKKQVDMGLRKGMTDLIIIYQPKGTEGIPRSRKFLFLEMKKEKGGTTSPEQKSWIEILNTCAGSKAEVAKGFEEAKTIIDALIF